MQIINGKKLSEQILSEIKREVTALPFVPVFCDILVGSDPSSVQYVKMKGKTAEEVGIKFHNVSFADSITTPGLVKEIELLNKFPNMCGIIVQLPLPLQIDQRKVLDAIDPKLDVDCLGTVASQKFYNAEDNSLRYPTALAVMAVLKSLNLNLENKNIVVLGQGILVGSPVTALLKSRNLFPTVITNETPNKEEIIKKADVIISGIGKSRYITGSMVKQGVVIIDAGTSESGGGIVGDVDLDSVRNMASYLSPVPGGVGPVTIAMLLQNVLTVAKGINSRPT